MEQAQMWHRRGSPRAAFFGIGYRLKMNTKLEIPEGFAPSEFSRRVPFAERIGPTYMRYTEAGIDVGAWVTEENRNGGQMAHGAFLIALADMATARLAVNAAGAGQGAVHISLSMDFFSAAPVGSWVIARGHIDRKGKSILFCSCDFYVGTENIGRATAVMKIFALKGPVAGDA
jgi:acyl-coenzyme A thioesterase PaaI-like protein